MSKAKQHRAKRRERVWIEWIDSAGLDGWCGDDEAVAQRYAKCVSMGVVVHKPTSQKPWWTLAGDVSDAASVGRVITIPECAVRKIRVLSFERLPRNEEGEVRDA